MRCLVVLLVLAAAACTQVTHDFVCAKADDCTTRSGQLGRCEPTQRCSYPDDSCEPSHQRYGDYAGALSNQCTTAAGCTQQVSAGRDDTCVVRSDGSAWCWGKQDTLATRVELPSGTLRAIATANVGRCARYEDGKAVCAAGTIMGDIGVTARDLTLGTLHTCIVTADSRSACWGDDTAGQLGDGMFATRPTSITTNASPTDVTQISAGLDSTCAVTATGNVWCWGDNSQDQLGIGLTPPRSADPKQLLLDPSATMVAVGDRFACAVVTTHGQVWCWGDNRMGQIGQGPDDILGNHAFPTRICELSGIKQVVAGGSHACALDTSGTAWCWGSNGSHEASQLTAQAIETPTKVTDASGAALQFQELAAGALHTCGRAALDGSVWCWGSNEAGQIGDGTKTLARVPTQSTVACP